MKYIAKSPSFRGWWLGGTVSSDGLWGSEPGMLETGENFIQSIYHGGPQISAPLKRVMYNFILHGEEFSLPTSASLSLFTL